MAKSRRGKILKKTPNWRGICPLCSRSGVKLLWDKVEPTGKIKVCKVCGNK